MKFGIGLSSFGMLVRPRVLTKVVAIPLDELKEGFPDLILLNQRTQPRKVFGLGYSKDVFETLELGDSTKGTDKFYVGRVEFLVVKWSGGISIVSRGNRIRGKVVGVGIKFFHGMKKQQSKWIPMLPWKHGLNKDVMWFYRPEDLVPISRILEFEKAKPGDIVSTTKTSKLVVKSKKLNKQKFWNTSSWSSYSVLVLNSRTDTLTRLYPKYSLTIITVA